MNNTEATSKLRIVVEPKTHEGLKALAGIDRRTLGAEVAWLVGQELEVRAIDPDTLEPKPSAEPTGSSFTGKPEVEVAPTPPAGASMTT